MTTLVFDVPDISCDHCRHAIEEAVTPLAEVDRVDVDLDAKTVSVEGGDVAAITTAIEEAGYDVAGNAGTGV